MGWRFPIRLNINIAITHLIWYYACKISLRNRIINEEIRRRTKVVDINQRISKLKVAMATYREDRTAEIGQTGTEVETTYGKAQRGTATCQTDQRPRQDWRESLDAGGIGPVTLEINWRGLCSAVDNNRLIRWTPSNLRVITDYRGEAVCKPSRFQALFFNVHLSFWEPTSLSIL